jgi:putative membrane protein
MCIFGPGFFWWSGMWVFPVMMMVMAALVIYLIFRQGRFRRLWEDPRGHWSETGGLEIRLETVKRRYAKGEISREKREDIKRKLLTRG